MPHPVLVPSNEQEIIPVDLQALHGGLMQDGASMAETVQGDMDEEYLDCVEGLALSILANVAQARKGLHA